MFSNLDYRTIRALHICFVFSAAVFIEIQLQMPRGAWTGFTVMLIYTGFDVGTSTMRIFHRFLGVLFGLLLAHIIWFIGYVNFRLLFLIIPIVLGFYYYFMGKTYAYATMFTTTLSVIGTDYFSETSFHIQWYIRDYFMCTLLAVMICVIFEYFIFFRINMTRKFYIDLQEQVISALDDFSIMLQQSKIDKGDFLNAVVAFNKKMTEFYTFVQNSKNDYHNKDDLIAELNEFTQYTNAAYHNLRKIFIAPKEDRVFLLANANNSIQELKQLISKEKTEI